MPITINGSGTLTGISAGGLPDGIITSAELAAGVGGKILQVVQAVKSDTFSTTSSSFTDVTGLSASITPASASNKVLVIIRFTHSRSTSSTGIHFRITRGGAAIFVGDPASSRTLAATGSHYFDSYVQTGETITFLDSPSATSSTTYALQCKSLAGVTAYVNRSGYDGDRTEDARTASSVILMEVAA